MLKGWQNFRFRDRHLGIQIKGDQFLVEDDLAAS